MSEDALLSLLVSAGAINAGAFALAGVYLRRKLWKIDVMYDAICGTVDKPGLRDRLSLVERDVDHLRRRPRADRAD